MRDKLVRKNTLVAAKVVIVTGLLLTSCVNDSLVTSEVLDTQPQATPTPEVTATPEVTLIDEHDQSPRYTMEVDREYMGVEIKAILITDGSLPSTMAEVRVSEDAYAEYIARSIFRAWWSNGPTRIVTPPTEQDFESFMTLWSKAQTSGEISDWEKVKFYIWGNDMNDGNGYVQEQLTVLPMFEGEAPEGIIGVKEMGVVLVNGRGVDNIDIVGKDYGQALGTNVDGDTLYVYLGLALDFGDRAQEPSAIASMMSVVPYWLSRGSGYASLPSEDKSILKVLLSGGIQVVGN